MVRGAGGMGADSVINTVKKAGLEPALLYEVVIELADEGLLTAGCLNAAAGILLTELGLPEYFFRHISKNALKRVLRSIATHIKQDQGQYVLLSDVAEVQFDVDRGVQVHIATEETRDQMEAILENPMAGRRVAYYFGTKRRYYTYIIMPQSCPPLTGAKQGASPFAFDSRPPDPSTPTETKNRYLAFLRKHGDEVVPQVEVSQSDSSDETRLMFRDDFTCSPLPVIRKVLGDLDIVLNRAYWETYRGRTGRVESVCSLYLDGSPPGTKLNRVLDQLRSLLAVPRSEFDELYVHGQLGFEEYLFAVNATEFVHAFIYKDVDINREIMGRLDREELREALGGRIFEANRVEYTRNVVHQTVKQHPELIKEVFKLFDRRFNPRFRRRTTEKTLNRRLKSVRRRIAITFIDDTTGCDIFTFMTRIVTDLTKTNFYKTLKRSFAFRLRPTILDPLVFRAKVYGVFLVVGLYSVGTHMRAEDVARGGLRLIRVTAANYENELDNMPLLNYALGPVAQHRKHKDIAEGGAKGVIVPRPHCASDSLNAVTDFTEGLLDLIQPNNEIVDYHGRPEMLFWGPDEGTAPFMDAVAERARERGYRHWRSVTTGKSAGIPHDAYGLTTDDEVFGLLPRGRQGTELQINGRPLFVTTDTARLYSGLADRIETSGMTTTGLMASLRTVLDHLGRKEEEQNLVMTGGPDGDLGSNQIQSWRGRISLIVDGGGILFDPEGLDRRELLKLAFARHSEPRLNSADFPDSKLGRRGFKVPRVPHAFPLPDGTKVDDGAFFHRHFLTDVTMRRFIQEAEASVFVPCGGFKDTIHGANVRDFLRVFKGLKLIVEGANLFFDDASREVIARETDIIQVRDSSANKGGVTSSSVAEVLSSFLLGEDYEKHLAHDRATRSQLIREVFGLIRQNAVSETRMLLALWGKSGKPLYRLSTETSHMLLTLQSHLHEKLDLIHKEKPLVQATLASYVPMCLVEILGMPAILKVFRAPELQVYLDAILTKKLAAMAVYHRAGDWDRFLSDVENDFIGTLWELIKTAKQASIAQ